MKNTKTLYVVQSGYSLLMSFDTEAKAEEYAKSLEPVSYGNSVQQAYVETYSPGELDYEDIDNGFFQQQQCDRLDVQKPASLTRERAYK